MGYRLEPDTVRKLALDLIREECAWDFGDQGDVYYIKASMYNCGVTEMMDKVIEAIEELNKA